MMFPQSPPHTVVLMVEAVTVVVEVLEAVSPLSTLTGGDSLAGSEDGAFIVDGGAESRNVKKHNNF